MPSAITPATTRTAGDPAVIELRDVGLQGVRVKRRKKRRFHRLPSIMASEDRFSYWLTQHLDLRLSGGDRLVLIDPRGERYHPVMRAMCNLVHVDEGDVVPAHRPLLLSSPRPRFLRSMSVGQSVRLLAGIYGMTDEEIEDRYDSIVQFAELGRLASRPTEEVDQDIVKQATFSVAVHAPTNLICLDRTSVMGASSFRAKCIPRLKEFTSADAAIALVTSDVNIIRLLGTRAIKLGRNGATEIGIEEAVTLTTKITTQRLQSRRARRAALVDDDDDNELF